jgi:hypothetical protein
MTIRKLRIPPLPGVQFRPAGDGSILLEINDTPTTDPDTWAPNRALGLLQAVLTQLHEEAQKWAAAASSPRASSPVGDGPLTIKPPTMPLGGGGAAAPMNGSFGTTQPGIKPPPAPMSTNPGAAQINGGMIGNAAPTLPGSPGVLPQPPIAAPPPPPNMGPSAGGPAAGERAMQAAAGQTFAPSRVARIEPVKRMVPVQGGLPTSQPGPQEPQGSGSVSPAQTFTPGRDENGVVIEYERDASGAIVRDGRNQPITKAVVKGPIEVLPQPPIMPPPPPPAPIPRPEVENHPDGPSSLGSPDETHQP